ncbi:hypothetical protein QUB68_15475 [Microcoleus sp. A006_D1]|uniref:hypothetical protein n=1 Tax=Microcoleus sp. A006_D1 TaxID=3055267 RepID=UPI002FD53CD0
MPNYQSGEVLLLALPFADVTTSKLRPELEKECNRYGMIFYKFKKIPNLPINTTETGFFTEIKGVDAVFL